MKQKEFSIQQFISDMQRDLLYHIILNLRRRKLTKERAQKVAQNFLNTKKSAKTVEEFLNTLSTFIPTSPEIHDVFLKHAKEFYEFSKTMKLSTMQEFMKSSEFGQAVQFAQTPHNFEQTLKGGAE